MKQYLNSNIYGILLFISLLPLFFVHLSDFHDWGDDFAQYLNQTKSFLNGSAFDEFAILNGREYGPSHRGTGFSLILSPVYAFFGHNIKVLLVFISTTYVGLALVLFQFYKSHFLQKGAPFIALLLVVNLLYNSHVLSFKMEIIPLFPFMVVLFLIFYLLEKNELVLKKVLVISVLVGLLISIKNMGWCLYLALLFQQMILFVRRREKFRIRNLISFTFTPVIVNFIIKLVVIGKISSTELSWYKDVFSLEKIKLALTQNTQAYWQTLSRFFEQEVWGWANMLICYSVLILFIFGSIKKWSKKFEVFDSFFLIYLLVLLVYPDTHSTNRFFIPLVPLILLYIAYGINKLPLIPKNQFLIPLFFVSLLMSNYITVRNLISPANYATKGPESTSANKAFLSIREKVSDTSAVAFPKPWVIQYYSGKKGVFFKTNEAPSQIENTLEEHNCHFILVAKNASEKAVFHKDLTSYFSSNSKYESIWENDGYTLFNFKTK